MDELEKRRLCPFTFGRVADKVFSSEHGWGVIHRVSYNPPLMGLIVAFDNGEFQKYTLSGYKEKGNYTSADSQELFWDEACTKRPMMPDFAANRNSVVTEAHEIGFGG